MTIIADNQPLTRDALTGYLAGQPLRVASDKAGLTALLETAPDATVVIDFSLFDFATPENMLITVRRFPSVRWLLLSADFTEGLLRLFGAEPCVSFLTKDCARDEVLHALYLLGKGGRYVCPSVSDRLQGGPSHDHIANLTPSETEVLALLAQGLSAKAIAERRCASVHTIITHKKNLFRKLGVSTTYEAVRYALRAGIADPVEYYI